MSALEVWMTRNLCLIGLLLATQEIELWVDGARGSEEGVVVLRQQHHNYQSFGETSVSPSLSLENGCSRTQPIIAGQGPRIRSPKPADLPDSSHGTGIEEMHREWRRARGLS